MKIILFALLILINKTFSQEFSKAIEDNSFLIEEAINQEDGIVQHISFLNLKNNEINFSFTQEWPIFSQTHQFSFTLLSDLNTQFPQEFGINYRYQLKNSNSNLKIAPRFSVFNKIGDKNFSYQLNLPTSLRASEEFYFHFNSGVSFSKFTKPEFILGGSSIWLLNELSNLMLEVVIENSEGEISTTINPGFRHAVNLSGLQIVPGISFPISLSAQNEKSILFYLSFEHPFQ